MKIQTREDLNTYFHQLYDPVKKYRQMGNGRLNLGTSVTHYSKDQAQTEGFLRMLWAVGPMAGSASLDLEEFKYFMEGICHSTDPGDPAFWGEVHDLDQMIVEMAALAVTLIETKAIFWEQLSPAEQKRVYTWLDQINHVAVHHNNWRFFRILVNVAFCRLEQPFSKKQLTEDLAVIESFYVGEGWYVDGNPRQQDYYIAWAFHYYGLLYAHYMKTEDPETGEKFIERAKKFAEDFVYWFSHEGGAVAFGRSLTYRFAQGAFWAAAAFTGIEVLPMAQVKYLLLQHFGYWSKQAIQKSDGILSIGYGYENFYMSERYNGPGSPYWCFKSFIVLGLEATADFWQLVPQSPERTSRRFIPAANMLVTNTANKNVQLYPTGQWAMLGHAAEKYSKLVYSEKFGYSVSRGNRGLAEGAFDNCLAVAEKNDPHFISKEETLSSVVTEKMTQQSWSPLPKTKIVTTVVPFGEWHVRIHEITTERELEVADGGFSNLTFNSHPKDYVIDSLTSGKAFTSEIGTTATVMLAGYRGVEAVFAEPNTNLLFPNSLFLTARQTVTAGTHLLISGHYGGETAPNELPLLSSEETGQLIIRCGNQHYRHQFEKDKIKV